MFKQNALAAATASDDGECFTGPDLKIDTAQNLLSPDSFCQGTYGNHWRRIARNDTRLNRWFGRWRRFDHRNAELSTLASQLSTCYSKTPLIAILPGK
jgi:hypothetical protein